MAPPPQAASLIKDSIGSIQNVMANTMNGLNHSVQQSLQMVQSMNSMMEAMLLQSLAVDVKFSKSYVDKTGDVKAPYLLVTLYNQSQLPLSDITLEFTLESLNESSNIVTVQRYPNVVAPPVLAPLTKKTTVIDVEYNHSIKNTIIGIKGNLVVTIKSPGNGSPLVKNVAVCISQIEQLKFSFKPCKDALKYSANNTVLPNVNLERMRKILDVPAFEALRCNDDGIYTGSFVPNTYEVLQISLMKDGKACIMVEDEENKEIAAEFAALLQ